MVEEDTDFADGNLDHHLGHDFSVVFGNPDFLGDFSDEEVVALGSDDQFQAEHLAGFADLFLAGILGSDRGAMLCRIDGQIEIARLIFPKIILPEGIEERYGVAYTDIDWIVSCDAVAMARPVGDVIFAVELKHILADETALTGIFF